jgi:hypothetical protein
MMRRGWFGDSTRHYLAAKYGVAPRKYMMATNVRLPQYQIAEIAKRRGQEAAEEARRVAIEEHLSAEQLANRFDVPYVRNIRSSSMDIDRAYEGKAVVPVLEGEARERDLREINNVSEDEAIERILFSMGRVDWRKDLEEVNKNIDLENRRVEGIIYDLTENKNPSRPMEGVLRERLNEANNRKRKLDEERMMLLELGREGRYAEIVPESEKIAVFDRIKIAPKREVAIAEAKENPVVMMPIVDIPVRQRGVEKKTIQTRVNKFMKRKLI